MTENYFEEVPAAVTIADAGGAIVYMNAASKKAFEAHGNLIGTDLFDCHPEPSKTKLKELVKEQRTNVYSIERNGVKKMIYQGPWRKEGIYAGFFEITFEVPSEIPHFVRK
ncbi:MAG: PAS domain-containing protein [Candidatus Hydrogenedentes bacterium]|nr:PAS domain-containing protein [Candidatus Hydrogenedentota bacterium]